MTSIYIDADACPVKNEIYRVAERYGPKVYVVSNSYLGVPRDPRIELVVVSDSFRCRRQPDRRARRAGDIVVTAEIPLADRSLKAGRRSSAILACLSRRPRSAWQWPTANYCPTCAPRARSPAAPSR